MEISPVCLKVSLFLKDKVSCRHRSEVEQDFTLISIQFSRRDCFSHLCSILQNSLYPRHSSSRDWHLHRLQYHSYEPRTAFGQIQLTVLTCAYLIGMPLGRLLLELFWARPSGPKLRCQAQDPPELLAHPSWPRSASGSPRRSWEGLLVRRRAGTSC